MRKLVLSLIVVCCFASVSFAGEKEDLCVKWAKLAETIMEKRQAGVPMTTMMQVLKESEIKNEALFLVKKAYGTPFYGTKRYKLEAINEFSNKALIGCLNSMEE
jgi:hypothetical protein